MASSSAAGAGTSADSDGEEQEDSSSSSLVFGVAEALDDFSLDNDDDNSSNKEGSDELAAFRQQWQRELDATPSPQREQARQAPAEPLTEEDKAKQLFREGVDLERRGKLYEAIQHYKRAMQILPDVETRLYESAEPRDMPEEESETEEVVRVETELDDDEDFIEGEDVLTRLQRLQARKGVLCEPETPIRGVHLSWLPYEVVLLIMRWVVSSELDAASLERLAASCRGLFVASRDVDIWRAMCVKTWGKDCGAPRLHGCSSWRHMYIQRPRILLHGCYISKTTYIRHGENSFQDQFYRPWYLIDYYRYLRFFSDGVVLMWTTPDEPVACVSQLKSRHRLAPGALSGHYKLAGDKIKRLQRLVSGKVLVAELVEPSLYQPPPEQFTNWCGQVVNPRIVISPEVIIAVKKSSDKKPGTTNTRFRSRRKETHEHHDTIYHLELQLLSVRNRKNWQLQWRGYRVSTRRDQCSQFELSQSQFPPFAFSRVRAYTAESHAPL